MIMHIAGDTEPLSLTTMDNKFRDEYEDFKENSNGGAISPPISPLQGNSSPSPTMVPDRREFRDRQSCPPSPTGAAALNIPNLHHALHGFHNLHNIQNLQSQMAALAGLKGSLGVPALGSLLQQQLGVQQQHSSHERSPLSSPLPSNNMNNVGLSNSSTNNGIIQGSVPQMVLTAGQVGDGVQGAQLLIPTSQGVTVQPILTIPLGQAGTMNSSSTSLVNSLASLHHLTSPNQTSQSSHLSQHHSSQSGSSNSSPLPPTTVSPPSLSSMSHSLLGVLPPSMYQNSHHGLQQHNNNNNSIGNVEKVKTSLPIPTVAETLSSLNARLGGAPHYRNHPTLPSRYSPDFLDTHNQPTISQATGNMVDGINLEEIKEFAKAFKIRRLSLGLTQTQVGQALSITEGPAYSQSAICRYKNGQQNLTDFMGNEPSKKRKRRTSFTPQALEILNAHFERITHPSGAEITAMGEQLGYDREVVRIWFCNKRQALKNTVRMMSKSHHSHSQPALPPHSSII